MRRRWVAEQPTMEMWLEAAQDFESEVVTWLAELPPQFRFSPVPQPPDEPENPFVVAQRCEIAAVAHSLVMKAYSPLLKRYPSRPYQPPSREAQLACVNAAHIIVQASQGIVKAFGGSRPASYVFYSFGRQIFAAAAVCANLVTHAPGAITAEPAMKDLATARELMRNPHVSDAKRHGLDSSALNPDKALRVVELLYAKAEEALRSGVPLLGGRGGHGGSDGEQPLPVGFTLPFMGGSLATGPGLPKVEPASTEHGDDVMQSTSPVRMSSGRGRLRSSATASRRGVEGAEERMLTRSSGRASTRAASVVDRTEVASIPLTVNGSKTPRARKPRKTSAYPSVGFRNRKNGPPTVKSLAIESMASGSTGSTHLSGPTVTGEIDAPGVPSGGPPLPAPQQTQLLPPPQPPHPGSFNMGLIAMPPTSSVGPETLVGVASPFRPPVHLPPVHHEQPRSHHGSPAPGPRSSMERRGSMSSSGFDSGAYAIPSDRQYHHYHDGAPRGTSYPTEYETPTTSSTSSGYYPSSYGAGAPTSSPYHHHPSSDPHHEVLGTTIPGSGGRGTPVSRGGGANSPFTSMVPPPHAQPTVHHYHGPTFDAHSSGGRPSLRSPHDSYGYSSPGAVTAPAAEDHRLRYSDVDIKPSGVTSYGYEGGREGRTNINAVEGSRSHGGHHRSSASPPQGQQPHHHSQLQQPHPHLQTHHSHSQPYQPHQQHHQPRHVPSSPGPHTSLYGNGMQPAQSQGAATSPWSESPAYGTGGSWTDYGF
ncbi:uncharacterized protein EI90DRAFT_154962 [Cantharellus anzutake]|uniref:uncharacterized protein n=1 Tax=Cantharellus anzutake TaxID=1750568 RepID=UPI001905E0A8|nr:uncharacterized protein EI90DRAFT_154962 [Cantharellus anzutake]KAF8336272.1 hypothetical protein EI90DRAFT_154962 [Cantharellus anzutake]